MRGAEHEGRAPARADEDDDVVAPHEPCEALAARSSVVFGRVCARGDRQHRLARERGAALGSLGLGEPPGRPRPDEDQPAAEAEPLDDLVHDRGDVDARPGDRGRNGRVFQVHQLDEVESGP